MVSGAIVQRGVFMSAHAGVVRMNPPVRQAVDSADREKMAKLLAASNPGKPC